MSPVFGDRGKMWSSVITWGSLECCRFFWSALVNISRVYPHPGKRVNSAKSCAMHIACFLTHRIIYCIPVTSVLGRLQGDKCSELFVI